MLVDDNNAAEGSHKVHASIFWTPVGPGALLFHQKCVLEKRAVNSPNLPDG